MTGLINDALCAFSGHRYRLVQEFGAGERRVCCERCHGDWVMNDKLRCMFPWDEELEWLYRGMGFEVFPGRGVFDA